MDKKVLRFMYKVSPNYKEMRI